VRLKRRPECALLVQLGCLWPVLHWALLRSRDGSDEPWGFAALVSLAAVGIVRARRGPIDRAGSIDWFLPGVALAVYALSFPWLTPLPRALLGLFSLALTLSQYWYRRKLVPGVLGLCLLTIPLVASLEFYASYPLRVITSELAQGLLKLGGLNVGRQGVNLVANGREVMVDPACSGLKMLWAGGYAVSVLDCLLPLRGRRVLGCVAMAAFLLVVGNGWRTAALYYVESGLLELPHGAHDAIGIAVFLFVLGAIVSGWLFSARRQEFSQAPDTPTPPTTRGASFFVAACLLALVVSLVPRSRVTESRTPKFAGFPDRYAGERLTAESAPAELAEFYRSFPGSVAHFRSGSARYVFRWVTEPTRRLHPARHCYRASGYETDHEKVCIRGDGQRYGCFTAERAGRRVRVSERIYDENGGGWTDVSAWYWAAVFGRSQGPWWVVTIAEPEPEGARIAARP